MERPGVCGEALQFEGIRGIEDLPKHQGVSVGISQRDYQALYDKLLFADRLFRERDSTNQQTIQSARAACTSLTTENVRLKRKNQELRRVVDAMRAERQSIDEDVTELAHVAHLLEMREQEVEAQLKVANREKEFNLNAFSNLQKDLALMVSLEEYHRLQKTVALLADDHKLAEESTLVFEEERHAAHLAAKEAEKRCDVFKAKADNLEIELRSVLLREEASRIAATALDQQVRDVDDERRDMSRRLVQLECEKSSLLTQINYERLEKKRINLAHTALEQQCAGQTILIKNEQDKLAKSLEAASLRELGLQEKILCIAADLEAVSAREQALQEKCLRMAAELESASVRAEAQTEVTFSLNERLEAALDEIRLFRDAVVEDL